MLSIYILMHQVEVLPLAPLQKAKAAYNEWKAYMGEMRDSTKESLQKGGPRNDASILGKLQQCINPSPYSLHNMKSASSRLASLQTRTANRQV